MGTDGGEVVETLPDPRSFKVHKIIEFNCVSVRIFCDSDLSVQY